MEFTTEKFLILLKSQRAVQFGVISLFSVISVFIYEILLPEYEALHTPFGTIWFAFKIVTVIVTISLKMGLKDFDTKTIFHVIILIMWVTSATFSMIMLMPPLPIPWTITTFLHLFHTSPIAVATIVNLVVHLVLFFYTIRGTNQNQKLKISRMGAYYINNIPRLLSISHIMFPFVPFNIHFVTDNFLQYEHDLCRLIGFTAYFSLFITMLFWILIFVTICVTFWVPLSPSFVELCTYRCYAHLMIGPIYCWFYGWMMNFSIETTHSTITHLINLFSIVHIDYIYTQMRKHFPNDNHDDNKVEQKATVEVVIFIGAEDVGSIDLA